MCVAMVVYFVILGRIAVAFIAPARLRPSAGGGGVALAAHRRTVGDGEHPAGRIRTPAAGSAGPRGRDGAGRQCTAEDAVGRIDRDAADGLFETVREELEADRDNWVRWYRLARAYDYAGDRSRARETMRTAVDMERAVERA